MPVPWETLLFVDGTHSALGAAMLSSTSSRTLLVAPTILAVSASALLVFSCGSTPTTLSVPVDAGQATDAGARNDASSSGSSSSSGDSGMGAPSECLKESTADACSKCCRHVNSDGSDAFNILGVQCTCRAENCQTPCADLCATPPELVVTAACNACIQSTTGPCRQYVEERCAADPKCNAYNSCVLDCERMK